MSATHHHCFLSHVEVQRVAKSAIRDLEGGYAKLKDNHHEQVTKLTESRQQRTVSTIVAGVSSGAGLNATTKSRASKYDCDSSGQPYTTTTAASANAHRSNMALGIDFPSMLDGIPPSPTFNSTSTVVVATALRTFDWDEVSFFLCAADATRASNPAPVPETENPAIFGIDPTHWDRLLRFYSRYAPQKLPNTGTTLTKYKGRESELMAALISKYGPEPPAPATKSVVLSLAEENSLSMRMGVITAPMVTGKLGDSAAAATTGATTSAPPLVAGAGEMSTPLLNSVTWLPDEQDVFRSMTRRAMVARKMEEAKVAEGIASSAAVCAHTAEDEATSSQLFYNLDAMLVRVLRISKGLSPIPEDGNFIPELFRYETRGARLAKWLNKRPEFIALINNQLCTYGVRSLLVSPQLCWHLQVPGTLSLLLHGSCVTLLHFLPHSMLLIYPQRPARNEEQEGHEREMVIRCLRSVAPKFSSTSNRQQQDPQAPSLPPQIATVVVYQKIAPIRFDPLVDDVPTITDDVMEDDDDADVLAVVQSLLKVEEKEVASSTTHSRPSEYKVQPGGVDQSKPAVDVVTTMAAGSSQYLTDLIGESSTRAHRTMVHYTAPDPYLAALLQPLSDDESDMEQSTSIWVQLQQYSLTSSSSSSNASRAPLSEPYRLNAKHAFSASLLLQDLYTTQACCASAVHRSRQQGASLPLDPCEVVPLLLDRKIEGRVVQGVCHYINHIYPNVAEANSFLQTHDCEVDLVPGLSFLERQFSWIHIIQPTLELLGVDTDLDMLLGEGFYAYHMPLSGGSSTNATTSSTCGPLVELILQYLDLATYLNMPSLKRLLRSLLFFYVDDML